mmetsp:Transcript_36206/g.82955  ORF Transcript_36206/g.82955 Transcript_36206/m.82955 type:complete len:111 (+) Transcript_36206:14-346(+)
MELAPISTPRWRPFASSRKDLLRRSMLFEMMYERPSFTSSDSFSNLYSPPGPKRPAEKREVEDHDYRSPVDALFDAVSRSSSTRSTPPAPRVRRHILGDSRTGRPEGQPC